VRVRARELPVHSSLEGVVVGELVEEEVVAGNVAVVQVGIVVVVQVGIVVVGQVGIVVVGQVGIVAEVLAVRMPAGC
jgi:hypothetical protein